MQHREVTYSLAKVKDCKDAESKRIVAFTLRTTDGEDESYASKRADATGNGMSEELIRFSLVSYDRELDDKTVETCECKQPFMGFDKWSTKARNFAVAAWKKLSTPDEDELKSFFASATEAE